MKVKCRGKEFDVYSLDEALSLDIIPIDNWRKADIDDWIRTADNKVIKVVGRREKKAYPKNKESKKNICIFVPDMENMAHIKVKYMLVSNPITIMIKLIMERI